MFILLYSGDKQGQDCLQACYVICDLIKIQFFVAALFAGVLFDFYRTQVNLGSDLWVRMSVRLSLSKTPCVDLTDVTLADEDTKSILTDNVNRAIPGNVAMRIPTQY